MRIEEFLKDISNYDFANAAKLTVSSEISGGWEVWFQVELALYLVSKFGENNIEIIREKPYPTRGGRCDFYIEYGTAGRDETYIELKCQLPGGGDRIQEALERFSEDIDKQKDHPDVVGFCLLASHGPWTDENIMFLKEEILTGGIAAAYVLIPGFDPEPLDASNVDELERIGFSLIAVSP
jgi:hypothetical protein